jgi:anti-anti-sigma regulatory factor
MRQIFCEDGVISICGAISFANVMQHYQDFCAAIDSISTDEITVNLAGVECVDSSVLPCLVLALNYAKKKNIKIIYRSCPHKLLQLINLCGLSYLIFAGNENGRL